MTHVTTEALTRKIKKLPPGAKEQVNDFIDFLLFTAQKKGVTTKYQPIDDPEDNDMAWYQANVNNPAFDFLKEPHEDIYRPTDGRPFHDQI